MQEFLRCGNVEKSSKIAFPDVQPSTRRMLSYRMRLKFNITIADLYRALGVTETKVVKTAKRLLNAKKIIRTYKKGELELEEETEDTYALSKGLDHTTKMLKIDPGQKILHGEDSENPFASLSEALLKMSKSITK